MMRRSLLGWTALVFLTFKSGMTEALAPTPPASIQQRGKLCSDYNRLLQRRMVEDNKESNDNRSIEEMESEASRKVASSLMFSWNLQEALTKTAWTFVLVGFLLNLFGYDYVVDKEHWNLRIDTIEHKQVQQELVRRTFE